MNLQEDKNINELLKKLNNISEDNNIGKGSIINKEINHLDDKEFTI